MEKNNDKLNDDAYSLLQTSKFQFLASMFPPIQSDARTGASAKKLTLGAKFSRQLNDLMATLNMTEPHYIRCIKPNPNKSPMEFHSQMSMEQLQYAGVFEAIQIRKQGFPFRLTHVDFWQRYKCIFPANYNWTQFPVKNCEILIREMNQNQKDVQIGTSRILYRASQHQDMELKRNLAVEDVTIFIQKFVRVKLAKILEQRCRAIRPKLLHAIQSQRIEDVEAALSEASTLGYDLYEIKQLQHMKHVYEETIRLDQILAILVQQPVNDYFQQFEEAVESCNSINMQTPNSQLARQMYAEAKAYRDQLDFDASEQIKILDEHQMKDVLDRAEAINYTSENLDKLRTLLYDTAEDSFAKLQLKAAVALNDRERITRHTIKLKDLFFQVNKDQFQFQKYSQLHSPANWVSLKFMCLNKEELQLSMLKHTNNPIHNSLTQVQDKQVQKLSKQTFKNLLAWMGDKTYSDPPLLMAEILKLGLESAGPTFELRTEIYCQLIKQLTNNPSGPSAAKGWDAMVLCLATFPPRKSI